MSERKPSYDLKYPIGEYTVPKLIDKAVIDDCIKEIERFPKLLEAVSSNISTHQLSWSYRPSSWSIKQVIHHCADSHINSFIRMKFALTTPNPKIMNYDENVWAKLPDANDDNITCSIKLLNALHYKWVKLLSYIDTLDFERTFFHPEQDKNVSIKESITYYAWHGQQHLAHIKQALALKNKF